MFDLDLGSDNPLFLKNYIHFKFFKKKKNLK